METLMYKADNKRDTAIKEWIIALVAVKTGGTN
jgi:hypothetical protein